MQKYDVAVLGGGFAGVWAAIAAAREGSRVILIEKGNALGGAAANALVLPFMSYHTEIDGKVTPLTSGILDLICARLTARDALQHGCYLEEELKYVLGELVLEYGVTLLYHAYLFDTEKDSCGNITAVSLATREGVLRVSADYFIDATGDAQLAYLAGFETVLGREGDHLCQPMTLCFRVGGVDRDKFYATLPEVQKAYKQSLAAGEFQNPREDILVFKTLIPSVLHFNTTRIVKKDPTSAEGITEAEILSRRQVFEVYEWLKKHADGLDDSFLMMTASEIGVRESRMIVGEYVLTEKDCRAFTKFEDAIAACNYDIDIHNPEGSGTSHYYFPKGAYYTIPYRSLIPKGAKNLLVAGRCISSDHGAQASYRIMPTVSAIGEAAGCAIGMAKSRGIAVCDLDISALQQRLKACGATIGI